MNCPAHLGLGVDPGYGVRLRKEVRHREAHTLYLVPKAATPNTHHHGMRERRIFSTQLFKTVPEGLKFV